MINVVAFVSSNDVTDLRSICLSTRKIDIF